MILKQFLAILSKNLKLLISTPIFLILNVTTIGILFILSCLPTYAVDDHFIFLRDQGQATIFFMGCITSLFYIIHIITNDFRLGTAAITLSRPIKPITYCAANLLSLIIFLGILQYFYQINYLWLSEMANDNHHLNISSLALFIITIIISLSAPAFKQYFWGGRYTSITNYMMIFLISIGLIIRILITKNSIDWLSLQNSLNLYLASITFLAFLFPLAILYSNSSIMIIGIIFFFFGTLSEYFFNQLENLISFTKYLNAFVPNWQIFWVIEKINQGHRIPFEYYIRCSIHTLLLLAITLTISTFLVKKIEITK